MINFVGMRFFFVPLELPVQHLQNTVLELRFPQAKARKPDSFGSPGVLPGANFRFPPLMSTFPQQFVPRVRILLFQGTGTRTRGKPPRRNIEPFPNTGFNCSVSTRLDVHSSTGTCGLVWCPVCGDAGARGGVFACAFCNKRSSYWRLCRAFLHTSQLSLQYCGDWRSALSHRVRLCPRRWISRGFSGTTNRLSKNSGNHPKCKALSTWKHHTLRYLDNVR